MSDTQKKLEFVVIGGGGRGGGFSRWILDHPDVGRVVAVAEPAPERRERIAAMFDLPADRQFESWDGLLAQPRMGDVAINTTMDRMHAESAIPAMKLGYHMLLEKPMAVTLGDCVAIDRVRRETGRIVAICHSLRYVRANVELKRLLDGGAIGELVGLDHHEPVGNVHQSHSFVRGNWANESRSTFMLMSKSCHDVDFVHWLVDRPCLRVASFGSLRFFRAENAPPGAPDRCTDGCPHEASCEYSALKVYAEKDAFWAQYAWMGDDDPAERREKLATSPFGRCVYRCDNDVVDRQVATFEFAGGVTGTFTMTAFGRDGRQTRLHGTEGVMQSDGSTIDVWRFRDGQHTQVKIGRQTGGHGGGDDNVMRTLVRAVRQNDPSLVLTGTAESLASHRIVFAAELARREGRVVEMAEIEALDALDLPVDLTAPQT